MARFWPLIIFKQIPTVNWTLSISKENGEDPDPKYISDNSGDVIFLLLPGRYDINSTGLSTSKNDQFSFWSLFFFVSIYFFFVSSRFDHNFISVYWPKFTGKAETKRYRLNLKNRSRFTKPDGRTAVRAGPCFFGMERFFTLNKPASWTVWGFSGRTVRSGPVRVSKPWVYLDYFKKFID